MPVLALLTGPFRRVAIYTTVALAIVGAGAVALHQHDRRVLAEQAAAEAAAVAAQQVADMRRAVDAANAEAEAATARANAAANVKREIARAPVTVACAASPAVRVVLDGMRGTGGSGAGAAGSPGGAVGVPAATGAPKPAPR